MNRMRGLRAAAIVVAVVSGLAPLAVAGSAATATAVPAPGSIETRLAFDSSTTSQQVTDFTGLTVLVDFSQAGGTPINQSGSCGSTTGYIVFTVTPKSGHATGTYSATACAHSGIASLAVPDSVNEAPVGAVYTVRAAYHPTASSKYAASITAKSATLTVAATDVVASAVIDYPAGSATKATVYGDLHSATVSGSTGDYEKLPTGTWKLQLTAGDDSKTYTMTRKTEPAGLAPQWSITGLNPGTSYLALATFAFPATDAGHHVMKPSSAAVFTTTGMAPTPTPTPTPSPTQTLAPAPPPATASPAATPTSTPLATATPTAASGMMAPVENYLGSLSPLNRIALILAAIVVLCIIGLVIGYAIYRHRNA